MKFEIKQYDQTYTITTDNEGMTISDVAEVLRQLLLAVGYHPNSVDSILNTQFGDDGLGE